MQKKIGITAIICTYNGSERIEPTLQHLLCQKNTHFEWEIILIDNASTDNTTQVARHILTTQNPQSIPYRLETEPTPGVGNARKLGFKIAKFEFICFVDDDNWLNNNYLHTAFDIMQQNPNLAACGGKGTAVANTPLPKWFKRFERVYACGKQNDTEGLVSDKQMYLYFAGCVVRLSAWQKLQEANFTLTQLSRTGTQLTSGEDVEICQAFRLAGYQLYYSPNLCFQHFMTENRLNTTYLKKLFKALPSSAPISRMYTKAVLKQTPTPYSTAILETFAACLFFCIKALISFQFLEFQMFYIYFKNRFLFLIKNKTSYNNTRNNIIQLQKNLQQ